MNILIIGNGFDLAHDLPTSYTSVLEFLYAIKCTSTWDGGEKKFIAIRLNDIKNEWIRQQALDAFNSRVHDPDNGSYKNDIPHIQEIYDNLDDNIWYTYLWDIFSKGKMKGINWIDFESEISFIIEQFDRTEQNLYHPFKMPSLKNEKIDLFSLALSSNKFLSENSSNYQPTFQDFIKKSYEDLRRLVRCIEIYLTYYVESIPISKISQDIIDSKPHAVLCFNYTHTLLENYSFGPKIQIHFLHGEARTVSSNNNMVLGIDEYFDSNDKSKFTNYNIYKKFTQRIINETGFLYREWLSTMDSLNACVNNVYIFGHSLDITDKDVIKDFIDRDGVKTTIYYHDKQQQVQQIANLVKMLGQEKFINMVNSIPPRICFIQQQPMVSKR